MCSTYHWRSSVLGSVLASAVLALTAAAPATAQTVVGLGGGFRSTGVDLDASRYGNRDAFQVFGFASFLVEGTLRVRPGVGYGQRGFTDDGGLGTGTPITVEMAYLEVPVMATYGLLATGPTGVHLFAGPVLSIEVGCEVEGDESEGEQRLDCGDLGYVPESVELGVGGGVSLTYDLRPSTTLFLNGYGTLGLTDMGAPPDVDDAVHSRGVGVDLGLAFVVGG